MNDLPATIVAIDDDDDTLAFVHDYFTMLGMRVVTCSEPMEVQSCVAEHQPQAVILDFNLPGMTGADVLQRLRAEPVTSVVPVVIFTANADRLFQALPDYASYGATLVLKPDVMHLSAVIQRLVQDAA